MLTSATTTNTKADRIVKKFLTQHSKLCHQFNEYINLPDEDIAHIFMGIGFISGKKGFSLGLPIDVLNMIITADEMSATLTNEGIRSQIHLLIGDHLAYHACHTPEQLEEAKRLALLYYSQIEVLIQNLSMQNNVTLHFSSQVINTAEYQQIFEQLNAITPTTLLCENIMQCTGKYQEENKFYFLSQTALGKYFRDIHGCSIKIGWSKSSKKMQLLKSENFDEPHFDRFYRELLNLDRVSFIYVDAGHTIASNDPVVPYCAPNKMNQKRVLFSKDAEQIQNHIEQVIPKSALGNNITYYYNYVNAKRKLQGAQPLSADKVKEIKSLGILTEEENELIGQCESVESYLEALKRRSFK